ncbi:MAG TPA: acetate kinase, partial [Vicinamibacteria bacterium]
VRAAVCAGLSEIGIELDPGRNAAARGEAVLSPEGARVAVLLVPADEERIVARAVARVVGGAKLTA